jgi:hypothetical protein
MGTNFCGLLLSTLLASALLLPLLLLLNNILLRIHISQSGQSPFDASNTTSQQSRQFRRRFGIFLTVALPQESILFSTPCLRSVFGHDEFLQGEADRYNASYYEGGRLVLGERRPLAWLQHVSTRGL